MDLGVCTLPEASPNPKWGAFEPGKFISPADWSPKYFIIIAGGAAFA